MKKRPLKETIQEFSLLKERPNSFLISLFLSGFVIFSSILCTQKETRLEQRRVENKKGNQERSWSNLKNIGVGQHK